jgi:hypothetical protein
MAANALYLQYQATIIPQHLQLILPAKLMASGPHPLVLQCPRYVEIARLLQTRIWFGIATVTFTQASVDSCAPSLHSLSTSFVVSDKYLCLCVCKSFALVHSTLSNLVHRNTRCV